MPKATEWQSLDLNPRLTSYYMLEERPLLLGVRGDEHLVNKGGKAAEIAGMADTQTHPALPPASGLLWREEATC